MMLEFFKIFLSSKQFIPHGHCYLWQSKLLGLHIVSDSLIAFAYYSIPFTLLYFVRKRRDLPFNWIFLLFATSIMCGTTHLMEIWTLWYPTYWLSGGIKAIAAVVSLFTAWEVIHLMPKIVAFPSPAQLEAANRELEREISERQQVEVALQEQEAMLRRIGDNLPNGAIYKVIRELDGSDRFSYLSAGIERLTEIKAENALKDSSLLYSQFIPEDVPCLQAAVDESMRNLSVFDIQLRICTPSAQLKWFHFRSSPRQLDDGRIAWDGLVVDVTELKRTEEILRKNEALLEESQRLARLGNWEYDLATGKISWSKGLFELFRRDPKLLTPSYEEHLELYHPEDREKLAQAVARAISSGECYKLVLRAIRTDGVEIYVEAIGYAEFNATGEVIRLYGTAQDISEQQAALCERKQAEAALQESDRRFRGIFNNTFQFTGLLNIDGILLEANQTALNFAGLKREDVINRPFWEAHWWTISPETQQQLQQAITAAAQGNFIRYEVDVLGVNNQVVTIDFSLRPLQDETGQVILLIPEGRDISDRKLAQEKLKQAELRYRTVVEQIPGVVYTAPISGKSEVAYISPQIQTLLNVPPQDWESGFHNSWANYVHPDDHQFVIQAVQTALATEQPYNIEYRMITHDGKVIWVQDQACIVLAPDGKTQILQGVAFNISDRKQAEAALRESEARFHAFMDNSPALAWITDATGHLIYLSQAFLHTFDLSSDQTFGKSIFEVFPTEIAQQYFDNNQTVIQTNEVLEAIEVAPRTDGTLSKYLVYKFPIPGVSTQKVVGGVAIDITERLRAEKMLELQAIITCNIAEGVCLVRANDGIIVYANPKFEQMFGYDTDELTGLHVSIVNYADDQTTAQEVCQIITAAVLQNGEASYEVHNVKKDGTPFWCRATTSVFEHPEYGKVLVAVQQDITEHKQAEEQIKASLKEKEVLLKEIHHRVKNNLGIVSSLLQMQCRRTQDSQAKAILRDSQNRIASIALVHEKLYRSADLANIDFAQYIPDLTTHLFDSYKVSSNCIKLDIQVDDASLDIETAIPCGLIINELVSNALKYAFPGQRAGKIQVKLSQQNQYNLILSIRDNGVGLPVDFNNKKVKTLGITLVQGLVKQLKGIIEINSQQGTEFKITFTKNRAGM